LWKLCNSQELVPHYICRKFKAMRNYLKTIRYQSERIISGEYENNVLRELNQMEGVEGLHLGIDFVEVDYYPQLESSDSLREALSRASFDFRELPAQRPHGLFSSLVSNLAKENRKTYGSRRPSCCG